MVIDIEKRGGRRGGRDERPKKGIPNIALPQVKPGIENPAMPIPAVDFPEPETQAETLPKAKRHKIGRRGLIIGSLVLAVGSALVGVGLLAPRGGTNPEPTGTPNPTGEVTPEPTRKPTPTVEVTPSQATTPKPEITLSPTQKAENETVYKTLTEWTKKKGNDGIPMNKLFTYGGKPQPLSLTATSLLAVDTKYWDVETSTINKGIVTLNDKNGIPHALLPIVQVDGAGNHYYLFINLGPINDKDIHTTIGVIPTRKVESNGISHIGTVPQAKSVLDKLKDDMIIAGISTWSPEIPSGTALNDWQLEFYNSVDLARQWANFTVEAGKVGTDYHKLLAKYPDVAKLINSNPTTDDIADRPFSTLIITASK
jgi:hypothetical protein